MSLEYTYSQLPPEDQVTALEQLNQDMWDTLDRLAAIQAGRAALMNVMKPTYTPLQNRIPEPRRLGEMPLETDERPA